MVPDSEIFSLINELNIQLVYEVLPDTINGVYYENNDTPLIIINKKITSSKLVRCVLCEEIGHYFTCIGNIAGGQLSKNRSLTYHKYENKALKWATDYLIPTKELLNKLQYNQDIESLMYYFDVTSTFLLDKLYFMSLKSTIWNLPNEKKLILSELPNIYIGWNL